MENWAYTFDKISKAGWLRQMEVDLKGKPLESLKSEWWPGEALLPALHAEDRDQEPVILPSHLFASPPKVVEWINVSSPAPEQVNKKVLEALQFGAESLILDSENAKEIFQKSWLENVLQDIVEINILVSGSKIAAIKDVVPDNILIRVVRDGRVADDYFNMFLTNAALFKRLKLIYNLQGQGSWIDSATTIFQQLLDDHRYLKNQGLDALSILNNQIIQFQPDTDYLKQIIQSRVIHLIWQNLFSGLAGNSNAMPAYLECLVKDEWNEAPEKFLVRGAATSLAASLSGVHRLCIDSRIDVGRPGHFTRNNRNIHHLLNMESEIYCGVDPLGGSYAIDFYARKWSAAIWNGLRR